jgi:hypothetical protein
MRPVIIEYVGAETITAGKHVAVGETHSGPRQLWGCGASKANPAQRSARDTGGSLSGLPRRTEVATIGLRHVAGSRTPAALVRSSNAASGQVH